MMTAMTGMRRTFRQSETMRRTLARRGAEGEWSLISDVLSGVAAGNRVERERTGCVVGGPQVERRERGDADADGKGQPEGNGRLPERRTWPNRIGQRRYESPRPPTPGCPREIGQQAVGQRVGHLNGAGRSQLDVKPTRLFGASACRRVRVQNAKRRFALAKGPACRIAAIGFDQRFEPF